MRRFFSTIWAAVVLFFKPLIWFFAGIRWLLTSKRDLRRERAIIIHSYPLYLFTWPIMALGPIFWVVDYYSWLSPETMAWIWIWLFFATMLTLGFDLDRNYSFVFCILIAAIWLGILYLRDVKGVTYFTAIYQWLADLDPSYNRNLGLAASIFLCVPFLVMMLVVRINATYRFTHNEIEHYQFGKGERAIARGAKMIFYQYPDLFQALFCLAGTIIICDPTGQRVLDRIEGVPLLVFKRWRIDRLMEETAVVEDADQETALAAASEGDLEHAVS